MNDSCSNRLILDRSKGIFPQALINYVTRTGGGFYKDIGAKPKSYSMSELQEMVRMAAELDS